MVNYEPLAPRLNKGRFRETLYKVSGIFCVRVGIVGKPISCYIKILDSNSLLIPHPGKFCMSATVSKHHRTDIFGAGLCKEIGGDFLAPRCMGLHGFCVDLENAFGRPRS